jgi:hypothetical protein
MCLLSIPETAQEEKRMLFKKRVGKEEMAKRVCNNILSYAMDAIERKSMNGFFRITDKKALIAFIELSIFYQSETLCVSSNKQRIVAMMQYVLDYIYSFLQEAEWSREEAKNIVQELYQLFIIYIELIKNDENRCVAIAVKKFMETTGINDPELVMIEIMTHAFNNQEEYRKYILTGKA